MLTTPKQENSTGTWWWTLSPLNYSGYAYLFHNHGKYDWDMGVVTYALRPSIALINNYHNIFWNRHIFRSICN